MLIPLLSLLLVAGPVELFMDWQCEAKGRELFVGGEGTLLQKLGRRCEERGIEVRSWEREKYRPWLLSWGMVRSWGDVVARVGWSLPKSDPVEGLWVFWSLGPTLKGFDFGRVEREKLVLFLWEPPTVQPEGYEVQEKFGRVLTWNDDLVDGERVFKFYYPVLKKRIPELVPFEEKKFCVMVASRLSSRYPLELYGEREKAIQFFEEKEGEFDLYGRFWEKRHYKNWRGVIGDKVGVIKKYKFAICYENTRGLKGYVTEKIFDCFEAGVVPVYWGAENVGEMIPEGCFVDRRKFGSYEELYAFLKGMGKEEYEGYLAKAAEFLESEEAQVFSDDYFVRRCLEVFTGQKPSS